MTPHPSNFRFRPPFQGTPSAVAAAWLVGMLFAFSGGGKLQADESARNRAFETELVPLLRTYCYECHGASEGDGDILLEKFSSPDQILQERKLWLRALGQVKLGSMPPADGPSLDRDTRERLVTLIDDMANAVNCVKNPNAGKVVLRRLNRYEYRNTIRDLLGVDYPAADKFPGDDVGYGFDNIGDVLSLPPLLMEKYIVAADEISQLAIKTPPPAEIYYIEKAGVQLTNAEKYASDRGALGLYSQGRVDVAPELPFSSRFTLTVTAFGTQAGDEPVKIDVFVDDKKVGQIDVEEEDPTEHTLQFRMMRGKRKLELEFANDYYNEASDEDRNLFINHVSLSGRDERITYIPSTELPSSHRKILFQLPDAENKVTPHQASEKVLERLTSRAFRRPAHRTEVRRLCDLAAKVRDDGGSFEESIQVALQAILVSPHFLFKVERNQPLGPDGQSLPLTEFELATRMSYFLWSSMPDDELLKAAWQGQLSKPNVLRNQVARMLKDRRSNQFIENFAGQWLQLRNLSRAAPDSKQFADATPEIRELMKRETLTFVAGVMRQNLPVTSLLDAKFTYLNEDLAKFYGIGGIQGDEFRQVSLDGTTRGGLLTQASILLVTSNPSRTSPVKRGKWILENLLNTPPPPPPPNVPELEKGVLSGTLRERMEQHRANPACATCHNMMDPMGFAMENFDAIGRWRTHDGSDKIDASGEMPDGTQFQGVDELKSLLVNQRRDQFVRCLTEKVMIYALGRGIEYYDKCAIDKIMVELQAKDFRFAYLIAGIVESQPFQSQGER